MLFGPYKMFDTEFGCIHYTVEYDSHIRTDVTKTVVYFWRQSKLRRIQHVAAGFVEDEQKLILDQFRAMDAHTLSQV